MYIIVGLIIFVCVLLILAVLAQNSKGGGLSSQFAGAGTSQLMGVKRTSDLLEQITWGLAIALIVLTLSTSFLLDMSSEGGGINSVNVERAQGKATAPQGVVPPAGNNNATTPAATPAPADSIK
ncbi:preprotein translocase subunit SecG [Rhodocytophaga rosea]|uniref:Protein-export membrane protein SecG n=1 Tax=Rhodocytophaga rosea TaxID=2704465 RepID=A0A6C0GTB3_9BACT|nr:preprotein translocase subunit SecG [Rhodocytophaga rosea]QHT71408.1 preprotein translocase subunit SecG [Rhodocytophaga rosea]